MTDREMTSIVRQRAATTWSQSLGDGLRNWHVQDDIYPTMGRQDNEKSL